MHLVFCGSLQLKNKQIKSNENVYKFGVLQYS